MRVRVYQMRVRVQKSGKLFVFMKFFFLSLHIEKNLKGMKEFLLDALNVGISICRDCSSAIEEINDGVGRSSIIFGYIEAYYAYRSVLVGYRRRYSDEFKSSPGLQHLYNRYMLFSPSALLSLKTARRTYLDLSDEDLPF